MREIKRRMLWIFGNVISVIQLTDLMIQQHGLHNRLEFGE